ncbi:MAG TPA: septum site-determining protein MinC [Rhodocyclaceae bacterium]|nr:septum site-determining protein MinC [Rhodocyclaceae bacterium]HRQ46792.1 septum site-determining protein MinC [Rhodocyclaceae bacterium]
MSAVHSARPIEFRNASLGATVAVLRETRPPLLADALHKMLGGMPDFFSGEAAILDFAELDELPGQIDWAGLLSLLRRFQLQPIGVRNLHPDHAANARKAGLAILDGVVLDERSSPNPPPAPTPAPAPQTAPQQSPVAPPAPVHAGTMFVDRPVRSGQQVYARGGDLVLLAGMSNGAEIIADGSIHCYGPLRGRALAGAQGNASARIISTNFGPEIVSIAGVYKTFEQGIPASIAGKPATVRLVGSATDQKLGIEPLLLD